MADSIRFYLTIHNRSDKTLTFKDIEIATGNFNNPEQDAKRPVKTIKPDETVEAMVITGAEWSASGTEGRVTYTVQETGDEVSMYWDLPHGGFNAASALRTCRTDTTNVENIGWSTDPTGRRGKILRTKALFVWLGEP